MKKLIKNKQFPEKTLYILLVITLVLFGIHLLLKYISIQIFNQEHAFLFELSNRFDVNDENSVPQWFSQLIFLFIAAGSFLSAYVQKTKAPRRLWTVIGVVGLLLSLDDVATLHEFTLQFLHITFFADAEATFFVNAWWLLLPIVLVIAGVLAWYGWKLLPRRTIITIVIGGTVFLAGKILMDSIANNVDDLFLERGLVQGIEKIFQYTGSSIVLYGILDYLRNHHGKKIKKAVRQLRS